MSQLETKYINIMFPGSPLPTWLYTKYNLKLMKQKKIQVRQTAEFSTFRPNSIHYIFSQNYNTNIAFTYRGKGYLFTNLLIFLLKALHHIHKKKITLLPLHGAHQTFKVHIFPGLCGQYFFDLNH